MSKKLVKILVVLLVIVAVAVFLINGIDWRSDTERAKDFYIEYMETWKNDREHAADYRYFVNAYAEEALRDALRWDELYSYEITSFEQLNDQLWVGFIEYKSSQVPDGYGCYNFVGPVDGQLRVFANYRIVPDELRGDLDLSQYDDPNTFFPQLGEE